MEAMMEQQDERKVPPAEMWDALVAAGMSEDDATAYVSKIHGPPPKAIPAVRPDATMALQRERPDASGDWEAIPDGMKRAAAAAAMSVPTNRALGLVAKGAVRYAPVGKAVGKALTPSNLQRAFRDGGRVLNSMKKAPSVAPKQPASATIEEALEKAAGSVHKPRHRTQAQFDYFAERMAQKAAEQAKGAADDVMPTLEDLLAASLDHVKKGGSLRQASDLASKVRPR